MGRRVSSAICHDARGRTLPDYPKLASVWPQRQVASGIDWPFRPQMHLVAPVSIAEATVFCMFSRAEMMVSPSCGGRIQEVDGSVCVKASAARVAQVGS